MSIDNQNVKRYYYFELHILDVTKMISSQNNNTYVKYQQSQDIGEEVKKCTRSLRNYLKRGA